MEFVFLSRKEEKAMRLNRYIILGMAGILLGGLVIGCKPRMDTMAKAEKLFIKMIDKKAAKLDLNSDQKAKLEQLKMDIRKNFQEGQKEKNEALRKIKEEGTKENPDIQKMTSIFQGIIRGEAQSINQGFDLLLGYQKNLNEAQKKKLTRMITERIKKWD
jgi:hypothetical protein